MSTRQNEQYWIQRKIDWVYHYWSPEHSHRKVIIDILKDHPVKNVLEVGCGAGANLYNIKKEFSETRIAGCDISEDAIATANKIFSEITTEEKSNAPIKYEEHPSRKEKRELGELHLSEPYVNEIEFKVGSADAIPFNGDSFDLILTDAMLIYIGQDKIDRVFREIRRVGYNKFIFLEFHSTSFWKRLGLKMTSKYTAYDYGKLLEKYHFKHIRIMKMSKEMWAGEPWATYGNIITAIR